MIRSFLMGYVSKVTKNTRYGVPSVLALFVIGGILFTTVNLKKGERLVKEYLLKAIQ